MKTKKEKGTIKKVVSLVHKLTPGYLTLLVIIRILAASFPFVGIVFSSIILDQLVQKQAFELIMKNALIMIAVGSAIMLTRWGLEAANWVKKFELSQKISQMICDKTFDIDYDVLEKHETLDMIKKAKDGMNSSGSIRNFCDNLSSLIEKVISIVYSVVIISTLFIPKLFGPQNGFGFFLNQWYSAFIMLFVMVLHIVVSYFVNKKSAVLQMKFFERNVSYNRYFSYWFNLVFDYSIGKYIRLYKMQKLVLSRVQQTNDTLEKEYAGYLHENLKITLIPVLTEFVLQLTSYTYVGLKAVFNLISVGSSLKYVTAYKILVESIAGISDTFVQMDVQSKYLSFFYDYMQIENKRYEGTIPTEKRDDNIFEIEFRDVSFKYDNSETYALRHVNQKITLGTKNAVVGKNGAGKTTFIKLLCRLYEPTEGQILLNGVDIRYYDYKDYAKLFSIVFQDYNLFSFPLGENVAAAADYDRERVLECIDKAGFSDRLNRLEKGLDTNLYQYSDENGVEISGGEAQKLAIARALYKDAPFVILDEPTSALDPVAEFEIYQNIDNMVKGKTSIYISHRMSSCRFCDNIIVFDEGQVIEQGSHEKLMSSGGLYSQLWNAQAQYYA
ncbi:MAG: ABC transporter ATP-binding protein [Spirochaetaceae bacterium]|nr:ABC transporter ATP-binding protein [Spirochaetaceae bacterium]